MSVDYTDAQNGIVTTGARASAYGIPTGMTLVETGTQAAGAASPDFRSASFTATGGTLGRADVAFGNGPVSIPASTNPYLEVADTPGTDQITGRIDELKSASISVGADGGVTANTQIASDPSVNGEPEGVDVTAELADASTGRTLDINGHMSNIPHDLDVDYKPAAGTFDYDAHGETLSSVSASVSSNQVLFGRVKDIEAAITGLPSTIDVNFAPTDGGSGASFKATDGQGGTAEVDDISAQLTDGTTTPTPLPAGSEGGTLIDTAPATTSNCATSPAIPNQFAALIDMHDVTSATVDDASSGINAQLDTSEDPFPVDVQASYYDPTRTNAECAAAQLTFALELKHELPSHVGITENPDSSITYGASAPITGGITFEATNLPGGKPGDAIKGTIHNAKVTTDGVPKGFTIDLGSPSAGGTVGVDTGSSGGFADTAVLLGDTSIPSGDGLFGETDPVVIDTTGGALSVSASVTGVSKLLYSEPAPTGTIDVNAAFDPSQLQRRIQVEDDATAADGSPTTLFATLTGQQGNPVPATDELKFDSTGETHVIWNSSAPASVDVAFNSNTISTSFMTLVANDGANVDPQHAALELDLPTHADVCLAGGTGCGGPLSSPATYLDGSDDGTVDLTPDIQVLSVGATGLINITGQICLPHDPHNLNSPEGDNASKCPSPGASFPKIDKGNNVLLLDNVSFENLRFEFADASTPDQNDEFIKVLLQASAGLNIGHLEYDKDVTGNGDVSDPLNVQNTSMQISTIKPLTPVPLGSTFDGLTKLGGVLGLLTDGDASAASNITVPDDTDTDKVQLAGCDTTNITKRIQVDGVGHNLGVGKDVVPNEWCTQPIGSSL